MRGCVVDMCFDPVHDGIKVRTATESFFAPSAFFSFTSKTYSNTSLIYTGEAKLTKKREN